MGKVTLKSLCGHRHPQVLWLSGVSQGYEACKCKRSTKKVERILQPVLNPKRKTTTNLSTCSFLGHFHFCISVFYCQFGTQAGGCRFSLSFLFRISRLEGVFVLYIPVLRDCKTGETKEKASHRPVARTESASHRGRGDLQIWSTNTVAGLDNIQFERNRKST